MVADGVEFVMGPPVGINKTHGAHRDAVIPKAQARMDMYAKKLREMYIKEGVLPEIKTYLEPLRLRQPEDTLEKIIEAK